MSEPGPPTGPAGRISALWSELRRRHVVRAAGLYAVVAWLVIQVAVAVFPVLRVPEWLLRAVVMTTVLGFPVAMVLAWAYDLTSGGLRRVSGPADGDGGRQGRGPGAAVPGGLRLALVVGVVVCTALAGRFAWERWLAPGAVEPPTAGTRAGPEVPLDPGRVAVLYFDDFSPDGSLRYLADGFTEALIHELSQLPPLAVVSRNGVKPFRDPTVPLDSIARILGAASVVEGSVGYAPAKATFGIAQEAGALEVTVQLVDGASGAHVMSRRIRQRGDDFLTLRDSIVAEAARLLGRRLGTGLRTRELRADTREPEAWELVQRAEGLAGEADTLRWSLGNVKAARAALMRADSLLARAQSLDPRWPAPVIERGWLAERLAGLETSSQASRDRERLAEGLAHADRALELEPGSPAALELRGTLLYDISWTADAVEVGAVTGRAERDLRAAVDADPTRSRAWVTLAQLLRSRGDFHEAAMAADRALEADPFLINAEKEILFVQAQVWLELERLDRAQEWVEAGRRRYGAEPLFAATELVILAGKATAGGYPSAADTAWGLLRQVEEQFGIESWPYGRLQVAAVLAQTEGTADSARAIVEAVRAAHGADPWARYYEALVRLHLGESEESVRLLAGFLESMPQRRAYVAGEWWWRPLRDDPGFRRLTLTDGAPVSPDP